MRIQCSNFVLRTIRKTDAEAIAKHGNNYKIKRCLSDSFPHPYLPEDFYPFFDAKNKEENKTQVFAIEINDEAAGIISLIIKDDSHTPSSEIGYWLGESYWGKGIMSEACRAIVKFGFENYPFLNKLFAYVYEYNIGSQTVLAKAGLKKTAVFKDHVLMEEKLTDLYYYELFRATYEENRKL